MKKTTYIVGSLVVVFLALPLVASAAVHLAEPNMNALTTGLVGYWPFDGNTTSWTTDTTQDVSGNGNTGTLINMSTTTSPVAGKIGQALKFNGSTQYITAPTIPINADVTVSAWVKLNSNSVSNFLRSVASKGLWGGDASGDISLGIRPDNSGGVQQTGTGRWNFAADYAGAFQLQVQGTSAAATGTWVQVVGVKKGNTLYLYLNGTLANSTSGGSSFSNNSHATEIGAFPNQESTTALNGTIDDVRIYNRALSAQEVALLYALGTASIAHSNTVTLSTGLLGYWPFDGNTTSWTTDTTQDLSGNGNTGTLVNLSTTTSPVAGKIGQALKFNGSSSYVDAGTFTLPTNITICVWVKPGYASLPAAFWFIAGNASSGTNGAQIAVNNSNLFYFALGNGFQSSNSAIPLKVWSFVCGTGNTSGGTPSLYVNAVKQSGTSNPVSSISNGGNFTIGKENGGSNFANAAIDDVRVYNRILSQQEITQLYSLGSAHVADPNTVTLSTGLLGYWPFDGNTTSWTTDTTQDLSGNNNTGTLVNLSTTTSPVAGKIGQALKFTGALVAQTSPSIVQTPILNVSSSGTVSWWQNSSTAYNDNSSAIAVWGQMTSGHNNPAFSFQKFSDGNIYAGWFQCTGGDNRVVVAASASNWPQNKWTYYTLTWVNGGNTSFYQNGVLLGTQSGTVTCNIGDSFVLGNLGRLWANSSYKGFAGSLDDFRIYNRALSAQEVYQLYSMGK